MIVRFVRDSISRSPKRKAMIIVAIALVLSAPRLPAQTNDPHESKKPLPLKPEVPGVQVNHRLILKDGSYQVVRKYEVVGSRVRYISVERGGEWEELPYDLVDWPATRKWEKREADLAEQASPAMQEAADLDKEESALRMAQREKMPEVAQGLTLPDQSGVFVLDEYQGTPQLVEITPTAGELQTAKQRGLRSVLPLQGQTARVELDGAQAKVQIHVNEPALYLSLDNLDLKGAADIDETLSHAVTVNTQGISAVKNPKRGATSPTSGFAIVRVDQRKAVRIVGTVHLSPTGNITQEENVIPMTAEVLPGKHWLKLTPKQPLLIGEYALVEILSPKEMNGTVWDFHVDPRAPLNESAIGPIDSK